MDKELIETFASLVESSLETADGQEWLNRTDAALYDAIRKQKFNTERAAEMFGIAIERSVLAHLGDATGSMAVMTLRKTGVGPKMAAELADQFKEGTGASDQRPARKGLLAMIIGK